MGLYVVLAGFGVMLFSYIVWRAHRARPGFHFERKAEEEYTRWVPQPYNLEVLVLAARRKPRLPGAAPAVEPVALDATHAEGPLRVTVPGLLTNIGIASMDGAILAANVHKWLALDDHVYEGISRMAGEQFDSVVDLAGHVGGFAQGAWGGLAEKAQDKVMGHIGEVYAAEHLEKVGAHIEWPDASNQAGWDFLLNGHEVNVKTVQDAASLASHFGKYPDIPAVIPADAANIPEHAILVTGASGIADVLESMEGHEEGVVIAVETFSHADVVEQTADATDALLGNVDLGIPYATLAFSGWREAQLLLEQKTDFATAAKNIGCDAVGTAGGGFAGAKAGAIAGSFFGPVGTLIGGALGAIGGAVVGRAFTDGIKEADFHEAMEHAARQNRMLAARTEEVTREARQELVHVKQREETQLASVAARARAGVADTTAELRAWRAAAETLTLTEIHVLSRHVETDVYERSARLATESRTISPIRRLLLGPCPVAEGRHRAKLALAGLVESVGGIFARAANDSVARDRGTLFTALSALGLGRADVESSLIRFEAERSNRERQLRGRIEEGQAHVTRQRWEAMSSISSLMARQRRHMQEALRDHVAAATEAVQAVRREAAKLGMA